MTTTRPTARLMLTTVAVPLLSTVLSVVLLLSWRDHLPERVATHWGLDGTADGFGSVGGIIWLLGLLGLLGVGVAVAAGRSSTTSLARTLGGTAAGTVVFVDVLVLLGTGAQRGTDDGGITFSAWWIALGAIAGLLAAAAVAVAVPRWRDPVIAVPGTEALMIGAQERVVWSAAATAGRAGTVVSAVAVAVILILTVFSAQWWLVIVAAALALTMIAMLSIRVTVDPSGLRIRGRLGWPRTALPVEQIAAVSVVQVNAFREFGGWGYRVAATGPLKGARGFVLHSGSAILVTTLDGRSEVTVVEGAEIGAALLEAYRLRQADEAAR